MVSSYYMNDLEVPIFTLCREATLEGWGHNSTRNPVARKSQKPKVEVEKMSKQVVRCWLPRIVFELERSVEFTGALADWSKLAAVKVAKEDFAQTGFAPCVPTTPPSGVGCWLSLIDCLLTKLLSTF
jgi:hypothetical protein